MDLVSENVFVTVLYVLYPCIPCSQISMSAVLTMEAATIPAPTLQAVSHVAATPDTHWPRMEGPAMVRRLVHALTVI